jgi:hypothetical protein
MSSISSAEFLASEQASKLPDWVKQNLTWKDFPTINKVFPDLGLTNCREPYHQLITDYGESDGGALKKMDICFSSDGVEGLWDIATMSMRGAMSCRHWDNQHARCSYNIVRDMAGPNMGIIYFTDGSMTEYGLSMNKRALVRYMPGEPARGGLSAVSAYIYMDRVYAKTTNKDPMKYINTDMAPNTKDIFKDFLKRRLNNKGRAQVAIH